MIVFLISIFVALGVSALCSLLEATVLSLTPSQVAELRPGVGALWQRFKARIDRPIAVILILNTAAHTIGATIAGAKFEELYGDAGLVWFSLLLTYLMLQFTEILPKTLGVHYNRQLAPIIAHPLAGLIRLLAPVLWFIHLVNRPFERKQVGRDATLEEITALAGLARLSNLIGSHQERIIKGAARLSSRAVREMMLPAEHISMLNVNDSIADCLTAAHLDMHTRFPVTERQGDPQAIIGYANFKDIVALMRLSPHNPSLRGIVRSIISLPDDLPISTALENLMRDRAHIALVRDAQGQVLGMITLEDVMEELVGDIQDEYDLLPAHAKASGTGWVAGGGITLARMRELTGIDLAADPPPSGARNLSAWVVGHVGHPVTGGEIVERCGLRIVVRKVRRKQVMEAQVTGQSDPQRNAF